jgi:hypothetical protein
MMQTKIETYRGALVEAITTIDQATHGKWKRIGQG